MSLGQKKTKNLNFKKIAFVTLVFEFYVELQIIFVKSYRWQKSIFKFLQSLHNLKNCLLIPLKMEGCHLMEIQEIFVCTHAYVTQEQKGKCVFSLTELPFTQSDLAGVWTNFDFVVSEFSIEVFVQWTFHFVLLQSGRENIFLEAHVALELNCSYRFLGGHL